MHLIRLVACSAADVRTAQGVGEAASRHTLRGTRAGPHPVGFVAAGTAVVAAAAGTVLQVALGAGLLERLQSAVSLSARSFFVFHCELEQAGGVCVRVGMIQRASPHQQGQQTEKKT